MTSRLELVQGDLTQVKEIHAALERLPSLQRGTVVLHSERDLKVYQRAFGT